MSSAPTVETGHEGSCPCSMDGVHQEGDAIFRVFPQFRSEPGEDQEGGRGVRLSIRLYNPALKPRGITLLIEWGAVSFGRNLDFAYLRYSESKEWSMVVGVPAPGSAPDSVCLRYDLTIPPGHTAFAGSPEYNYSDLQDFLRRAAAAGATVEEAGKSREGRAIPLVTLPSPRENAPAFLLQARDHPYETAGSFFIEGAFGHLVSGAGVAAYLRAHFEFHFLPMTNPDGVVNGMSRFTWERGADLNRVHTKPDPAHDAIRSTLDRIRPGVYLNIHNWTHRFTDGLLANDREMLDFLLEFLPADHARFKHWKLQTTADFLKSGGVKQTPPESLSWKNYCKQNFDAIGLVLEFPWFARNVPDMLQLGAGGVEAVALAALRFMETRAASGRGT